MRELARYLRFRSAESHLVPAGPLHITPVPTRQRLFPDNDTLQDDMKGVSVSPGLRSRNTQSTRAVSSIRAAGCPGFRRQGCCSPVITKTSNLML